MKSYKELLEITADLNGCKMSTIKNCTTKIYRRKRDQKVFVLATNSDLDHEFIECTLAVAGFEGSILVSMPYTSIVKLLRLRVEDYILQTPCGANHNWFLVESLTGVDTGWESNLLDYCATTSGMSGKVYRSGCADSFLVEDARRIIKCVDDIEYQRLIGRVDLFEMRLDD
ncbi:MAG: hypothetical protein WCG55_01690 [bacterium]